MRQLKISNSITSRESPSLDKYLVEINRLSMISPDEEARLSEAIRKGDRVALHKLIKSNLRFVVSVAKQYQGQGLPLNDLINEGNLGLMKAAERFDESRGFKFISFAVWWIRQNILQALAEHARMIRVPLNKVLTANRVQRMASRLEQDLERPASVEEIAEALQIETAEVEQSFNNKFAHLSLDSPINDDEESTLLDTIINEQADRAAEDFQNRESLKKEFSRIFSILNERQKETLCYFYGIGIEYPMSLEDIGKKFDLTPERVRQIKEKALSKLRTKENYNLLRGFLG